MGEITETEEEVEADDTRFTSQSKVGVAAIRATALAACSRRIVAVEHGLESDGRASYEVDILEVGKEEVNVEIGAATGKIADVGYGICQLGEE